MNDDIGRVIDIFKQAPDLSTSLPSFAPTLAELNYIYEKITKSTTVPVDFRLQYEQIIKRHIPDILNKYLALPISVRTTEIIKEDMTARDILSQELALVTHAVKTLWQNVLEEDKHKFLALNRKINTVMDSNSSLSSSLELEAQDDFAWNPQEEGEKLLKEYQGNWETNFQRPKKEIIPKKGIKPEQFLVASILLILFLVVLTIMI